MMKNILIISFATVMLFSCGGSDDSTQELSAARTGADKLGLIKSDVEKDDETLLGAMPEYSIAAPGTAERIEPAFENAPPMIPHMTEGFFPITIKNNICLTCHMPNLIETSGAVAIPVSHFTEYRPELIKIGQNYHVNAKDGEITAKSLGDKLSNDRFNCSQCHVPQANVTIDIKNTFDRIFRDEKSKTGSNLNKNIGEGVN